MNLFLRKSKNIITNTTKSRGLEEFIDSTYKIKDVTYGIFVCLSVGRAWKASELRLKSTSDLQKLWFVLLKERNALYTVRYDCRVRKVTMPHPERLQKVKDSMARIKLVIHERYLEQKKLREGNSSEKLIDKTKVVKEKETNKLTDNFNENPEIESKLNSEVKLSSEVPKDTFE